MKIDVLKELDCLSQWSLDAEEATDTSAWLSARVSRGSGAAAKLFKGCCVLGFRMYPFTRNLGERILEGIGQLWLR